MKNTDLEVVRVDDVCEFLKVILSHHARTVDQVVKASEMQPCEQYAHMRGERCHIYRAK